MKLYIIIITVIVVILIISLIIYKENYNKSYDIIIQSPGGVGCSVLFDIISKNNPKITMNSDRDQDGIKHPPKPLKNLNVKKLIYIMNDPLLSIKSHYRRNWSDKQMKKLGNYKYSNYSYSKLMKETNKMGKDLFGIEKQFDNFLNNSEHYPILFVDLNSIPKHKNEICEYLGIDKNTFDNFNIKERKSELDDNDLLIKPIYDKLYRKMLSYDMKIISI